MKNVAQAMADSVVNPTKRNGSKFRNLQNKILAFVAGSSTAVTTGTLAKSFNTSIASINTRSRRVDLGWPPCCAEILFR